MVDVRHVADISVFIGEKFPCRIVELNREKGRIILSRKAVLAAERREKAEQLLAVLEEGQTRSATILSLQPYGAFADLGGIDGLIHISDLSHDRIRHAKDAVKEGEVVQVKILRKRAYKKLISASPSDLGQAIIRPIFQTPAIIKGIA